MFLTDNPDFTYFKKIYSRESSYTTKSIEVPFDNNNPIPGDTLISTIPKSGSYIKSISIKLILPKLIQDSQTWVYKNPKNGGTMFGYSSSGQNIFTVVLNGSNAFSNTSAWYSSTGDVTITASSNQNFSFSSSTLIDYVVFSDISIAQIWGFIYSPQILFGGYAKFNINKSSFSSQVTFQESGWLPFGGDSPNVSYVDDVIYKFMNNVSLLIGNQVIQRFDSTYLKSYEESQTTYKNRPVTKLLEGNKNVIDSNRTYYLQLPFVDVPIHAVPRQDVKIVVETNQLNYSKFSSSLVIEMSVFKDETKLPSEYTIPIVQISRFTREDVYSRGPMKGIVTFGNPDFKFVLNGEEFINSDMSNVYGFENLLNLPTTSNIIPINNPINMSRIETQKFISSNVVTYTQNINILKISNGLAGLMFDYSSTVLNEKLIGNIISSTN